ncbi:MAG: hypothetical protein K0R68_2374 [Mycobacterium sp.]|nr:hypothetical protein [Mycobacterium sp.]
MPADERGIVPRKLPPGRHNLTRAEVAADQRGRMIVALGEAMAAKGYANTTVGDVIDRAKVSKQTFYQFYDSKLACFMDAFARTHERLEHSSTVLAPEAQPMQIVDAVLAKYLDTLADNATMARLYLIEVYAAGPDALRVRMEMQQDTVTKFAALMNNGTEEGRFACRALVAAISALVTHELVTTGPDGVRQLHAPLMGLARTLFAD